MTKKIYLETFKKCPGSLHFTLLASMLYKESKQDLVYSHQSFAEEGLFSCIFNKTTIFLGSIIVADLTRIWFLPYPKILESIITMSFNTA